MVSREAGFSLVEMLVALALTLIVTGAAFGLAQATQAIAQALPDAVDMQQRLRAGVDAMAGDLAVAGAGMDRGAAAGALIGFIAPVIPRRLGTSAADASTVVRPDVITILSVPAAAGQGVAGAPLSASSGLVLEPGPGCPAGRPLCGIASGSAVLAFDSSGRFDVFTIVGVSGSVGQLRAHGPGSGYAFPAGTPVTEVEETTYSFDAGAGQLRKDNGDRTSVPVIDQVAGFDVEYFGDPRPPARPRPAPATENCLYGPDGQLRPLGTVGSGLVPLPLSMFGDGPWCGSGGTAFDADLLRVRMVRVTVRVRAVSVSFRASGALFERPGTSRASTSYLPDLTARFAVAPPNLGVGG